MIIKNFLNSKLVEEANSHDGTGVVKSVRILDDSDFNTKAKFVIYTVVPPNTSIGKHTHGNDEELYIILEGSGTMIVEDEMIEAKAGDVFLNKPYGTHGLINNSNDDLKMLVLEIGV